MEIGMPWKPEDASRHMAAAKPHGKQWAEVANSVLAETGDEGRAIREANAAVNRTLASHHRLAQTMLQRRR